MAGYIGSKAVLFSTTAAVVTGDMTVDTNTLYVDSTNNRVGVGNTTPTTALDVTGDITAINATLTGDVTIGDDLFLTGPTPKITLTDNDVASEWTQITNASGNTFYISRSGASKGQHIFQQNAGGVTTEAMRINSSGNVGIGLTGPSAKLEVAGKILAQDEFRAEVVPYATNQDMPYMIAATTNYDGATTNWGTYGFQHRLKSSSGGAGRVTIDTFNGEAFSVTATGVGSYVTVEGDLHALGGIHLGGTVTANKLDDYEEGTWTPVVRDAFAAGNTATVATASGTYTKVGNKVTLWLQLNGIDTTGMTAGNVVYVTGAPFASVAKTGTFRNSGVADVESINFTGYLVGGNSDGGSEIIFKDIRDSLGYLSMKVSDILGTGSDIYLTYSYETT